MAPGRLFAFATPLPWTTDYGTEINSLKAISLMAYVASVLREKPAVS